MLHMLAIFRWKTLFWTLTWITALTAFFLLGYFFPRPSSAFVTASSKYSLNEDSLWGIIQEWRTEHNLPTYTKSQELCDFAKVRVYEIKTDWSHQGFHRERFLKYLSNWKALGENLGRQFHTEDALLTAWLNSPGHRANLDAGYTHSCVIVDGEYIVHLFGNPS